MGYNILNSIELAKKLDQSDYSDFRMTEYHGYPLYMYKWRVEDFKDIKLEYLKALEEFYRLGGDRQTYLKVIIESIRRWIEGTKLRR